MNLEYLQILIMIFSFVFVALGFLVGGYIMEKKVKKNLENKSKS